MANFTTEDLLLFMHNEMSCAERTALEQELQNNWALREKLQVLKESVQSLQKLKLQGPRSQTIRAIMDYAMHSGGINSQGTHVEYLWLKR